MDTTREIRQGYKKTKLGWIPEEWEVTIVIKCLSIENNKRTPINEDDRKQIQGDYPYYGPTKIQDYIDNFQYDGKYALIAEDGDHFLKYREVSMTQIAEGKFNVNNHAHVLKGADKCSTDWFYWFYNRRSVYSHITRQGAGRFKLNKASLEQLPIVIPPLPEQKKITKILSTWDKAIEHNQNLIEQLKRRKKGLMQQLLTGKTRLKEFSGEWKVVKGGELFSNHSNKNHDGTPEVLSATQDKGVIPRSETGIDIKYDKASLSSYKKVEIGDYVISLRSFQGGVEYSNYEGLVSPAYTVLKNKMPISKMFYKEYMKTSNFINILNSIIYGIRDGKQISFKEFAALKLFYPPLDEQTAIAQILTTSDNEIKAQENYLAQLQAQKKGLMQQLLTGQKRVIVSKTKKIIE